MKMLEFAASPQVENVCSLWAFLRDGDSDELIPLDIPPSGALVNMKDGSRVMLLPIPAPAKRARK